MLSIVDGGHRDTNTNTQLSPPQKYACIADYALHHKLQYNEEQYNDRLHENGLCIPSEHFEFVCFFLTLRQNRQNTLNNSPKECHLFIKVTCSFYPNVKIFVTCSFYPKVNSQTTIDHFKVVGLVS